MESPNTIYLVDLENVGTKVLFQHAEEHKSASYIVFYSDSTSGPGTILEHLPMETQVTFVNCHSGGDNAMDFCICATAGRLSTERKMLKILSNDKGYDPMLRMFHEEGIRIAREVTACQATKEDKDVRIQPWQDNIPIVKAIRGCVPKQYQDEVIMTLPGAPSRARAHEMLQAILPQKMVPEVYKKLKKHIPKEVI